MKKLFGLVLSFLILSCGTFATGYSDYSSIYDTGYAAGYSDGYFDGSLNLTYDDNSSFNEEIYTDPYVSVTLNGDYLYFENEDAFLSDGVTYVPMREMFEQLGAKVIWNASSQSAMGIIQDTSVDFFIGANTYFVNGEAKALPSPPVIRNGCTMVPLRALSEDLGAEVSWDNQEYTAKVLYLYPLSEDEQYLYDIITNKDIPVCEQNGSLNLSVKDEQADINLNMDIKTISDGTLSYSTLRIGGNIFKNIVSVDANIQLWTLIEDKSIKAYASVNGGEFDNWLENMLPYEAKTNYSTFEKAAVYSLFNNMEIISTSSKNGQKIIASKFVKDDTVTLTYYIDEKTNLISKLIIAAMDDSGIELSPIEIDFKYGGTMPKLPDFLK